MILREMSTSRADAIETCMDLSKKFTEHFNKAYSEGITSTSFHHHCSEMQAWWNKANAIKFKHNNKKLSNVNLIDWFFTGGSTPEDFLSDDTEIDVYNELIVEILSNRETANIEELLYNILLRYGV